jgi:hypothetical protein
MIIIIERQSICIIKEDKKYDVGWLERIFILLKIKLIKIPRFSQNLHLNFAKKKIPGFLGKNKYLYIKNFRQKIFWSLLKL